MGMQGIERRLERMVEGTFARIFRSGLRPVELGRRLVREMDDGRSIDVRGRTIVPNHFTVRLAPDDHDRYVEVHDTLCRELVESAREHARDEGYHFPGPVRVELTVDCRYRTGSFAIDARLREAPGGHGAGSLLLPDGRRIPLEGGVMSIGRLSACDVTIADPNVSRHHAEIRPAGDGYVLVDLGSTNGSRINGVAVGRQSLVDGDELGFGSVTLVFEES